MSTTLVLIAPHHGDNSVDDIARSRAAAVDDLDVIHCGPGDMHQPVYVCGHHEDDEIPPDQGRRAVVHDPQPLLLQLPKDLFSVGTSESELV